MLPIEALVDVRGAAELLGVARDTMYRLCADGEVEHFRVRNRIRISIGALKEYLETRGAATVAGDKERS